MCCPVFSSAPAPANNNAVNHVLWWFNNAVTLTLWALASCSRLTGDMLGTVMCDFMQSAMSCLAILTTDTCILSHNCNQLTVCHLLRVCMTRHTLAVHVINLSQRLSLQVCMQLYEHVLQEVPATVYHDTQIPGLC